MEKVDQLTGPRSLLKPTELWPWAARQTGNLEPGKKADIILVGGDPLTDITALQRVDMVKKDGQAVAGRRPIIGLNPAQGADISRRKP